MCVFVCVCVCVCEGECVGICKCGCGMVVQAGIFVLYATYIAFPFPNCGINMHD